MGRRQELCPSMLRMTFDMHAAGYNRFTNNDWEIKKLVETWPYHENDLAELDDGPIAASDPAFDVEPIGVEPILEQYSFPKAMQWHTTAVGFSDMMHRRDSQD
jgi:hypothetical protein